MLWSSVTYQHILPEPWHTLAKFRAFQLVSKAHLTGTGGGEILKDLILVVVSYTIVVSQRIQV
jgi:hypothetical protein